MAGALYKVDYRSFGTGSAVIYIGDDGVTGTDIAGGIWSGRIVRTDRARGQIRVRYPAGGTLVTGRVIAPGESAVITVDLEPDFPPAP